MTDIAKLGYSVDTSGLEKGTKALDDFQKSNDKAADSAQKASDAIKTSGSSVAASADQIKSAYGPALQQSMGFWDNFKNSFGTSFQQAINGTSGALTNAVAPVGAIEAAARRAGISYQEMQQRIAAASAAQSEANAVTGQSGGILSTLAGALGLASGQVTQHGGAVRALASEHRSGAHDMTEYREIVHSVGPALEGLGVQLSTLTQFSYAARGGMGVLAAAVAGGLLVALGKSRDEIDKMNFRLQAFAGSKNGEQIAADLKKASDAAGVMPSQIAPAVESVLQLQNALLHADPHVIYAPGYNPFDSVANGAASAARAVQTVTEQFKLNQLDSKDAAKATDDFFASVLKNSGLTDQEFGKLRQEAPEFAAALAKAFNTNSIYEFQNLLKQTPIPVDVLMRAIQKLGPATDQQFKTMQASSMSFGESVDNLRVKADDLWTALAGKSSGDSVKQVIDSTAKEFDQLAKGLPDFRKTLEDNISKPWSDMVKVVDDQNSIFGKSLDIDVDGAIQKALATLGRLPGEGLQYLADFANGAIPKLQSVADAALSMAQKVASAVAGMFSGGGGNAAGMSGGGNPGNTDALGNVMGGSGGSPDVSSSDLPAFAGGGQFTVSGSGGTDSQMVSFMATPGEVVTITTPGGSSASAMTPSDGGTPGGIPGLTTIQGQPATSISTSPDPSQLVTVKMLTDAIDQSTIDISKQVLAGSNQIVNTLNQLLKAGGVPSSTIGSTGVGVAAAAGATLGAFGAGTAFGGSGGSGGGGFNTKQSTVDEYGKPLSQSQSDRAKEQQAQSLSGGGGGMSPYGQPTGFAGQYIAQGHTIKGAFSAGGRRVPSSRSASGSGAVPWGGMLNGGNVPMGPSESWDMGANGPWDSGYGVGYNGISTDQSAFGDYGGPGWIYPNESSGTFGGSDYYGSSFNPNDANLGYMPNTSSGFPDSTATTGLDSLGPQNFYSDPYSYDASSAVGMSDFGSFADGGSFTAGSPTSTVHGSDTISGMIHLRPGEEVKVTPPGGSQPVATSAAVPSKDISGSRTGGNSDRPVVVNQYFAGQAANMASSMSRAQTQRMIRQALQ